MEGKQLEQMGRQFYKLASSMANASSEYGTGNPVQGFTSLIANLVKKQKKGKK